MSCKMSITISASKIYYMVISNQLLTTIEYTVLYYWVAVNVDLFWRHTTTIHYDDSSKVVMLIILSYKKCKCVKNVTYFDTFMTDIITANIQP